MTVELVSTDMLPVVCSYCRCIIRHIPAGRQVKEGEASHGICTECVPKVKAQWGLLEVTP